jgi:hypothetical protein
MDPLTLLSATWFPDMFTPVQTATRLSSGNPGRGRVLEPEFRYRFISIIAFVPSYVWADTFVVGLGIGAAAWQSTNALMSAAVQPSDIQARYIGPSTMVLSTLGSLE